jgi:hypothetical protein
VTIRFLEIAEIELNQAVQWYEAQAPGLGQTFLIEVLSWSWRLRTCIAGRTTGAVACSDDDGNPSVGFCRGRRRAHEEVPYIVLNATGQP